MTIIDHQSETVEQLQRLAYHLHHIDGLPWETVAAEIDEPIPVAQDLAQAYIDRTDAAARDIQTPLF